MTPTPRPLPSPSLTWIATLALAVLASGCDLVGLDDDPNPNGLSLEEILADPSAPRLSNAAVGVETSARTGLGAYLVSVGVLGREYWRVSPSDPPVHDRPAGQVRGDARQQHVLHHDAVGRQLRDDPEREHAAPGARRQPDALGRPEGRRAGVRPDLDRLPVLAQPQPHLRERDPVYRARRRRGRPHRGLRRVAGPDRGALGPGRRRPGLGRLLFPDLHRLGRPRHAGGLPPGQPRAGGSCRRLP